MTKLYRLLILSLLLVSQMAWGQTLHKAEVLNQFTNSKHVRWTLPIGVETPTIEWYERHNSLSASEGIRTFAGYHDGSLLGVVSVSKGELSGSITWKGASYQIQTKQDKIALVKEEDHAACGTCTGGDCGVEKNTALSSKRKAMRKAIDKMMTTGKYDIYTDGVLKVYRLALLVDYDMYAFSSPFYGNVDAVKRYWASAETFLNELYLRDVGIRFEIVQNDNLIINDISRKIFTSRYADAIAWQSTAEINKLIGEENYDLGVAMATPNTDVNGKAAMYSAYSKSNKGCAYARANVVTLAHEIGHMFGSDHTFSNYQGGLYTMNTEPGVGTSVMSYDTSGPRDFFSLASLYYIRHGFLNEADFYTTTERVEKKGPGNSENIVYGIETGNRPPAIDRSKLRASYTLPKGCYFQFKINASDPDGHKLLYTAHQVDFRRGEASNAKFASRKPTEKNVIAFEPAYAPAPALYPMPYNAPEKDLIGTYTFWLGVSDGGEIRPDNLNAKNHATRYDMFTTTVTFEDGVPFTFIERNKSSYKAGEKVTLKWGVDKRIFGEDSKVRILMSDDFGQTYKYVLAEGVPNNGSCEVTIPPISIGRKEQYRIPVEGGKDIVFTTGLGLFKIEVIDHIAHTISENNPMKDVSGFSIEASQITFQGLPEQQNLTVKKGQLPDVPNVTATSTAQAGAVDVQFSKAETEGLVVRTWTATDNAGNSAEFKQFIYVENVVAPLQFEGELPKDMHVQCKDDVPEVADLKIKGGTNPQIIFTQTRVQGDNINFTLKRTWTGTDVDAAPISHTQTIYVNDITKPTFAYFPQDMVVSSSFNIPFQRDLEVIENCAGDVTQVKGISAEMENGLQVTTHWWTITDAAGNGTTYRQKFTIDPNTACQQVVDEAKVGELLASADFVGGYTSEQLVALRTAYDAYKTDVNNCAARTNVINAVTAVERLQKITFDSRKLYRIYNVRTNNEVLYVNYETNQVATRTTSDASKVDELWTLSATNGNVTITNPNTKTSISSNGELGSGTLTLSDAGVAKFAIAGLLTAPVIRLKEAESISLPIGKKYATFCYPFDVQSNSSSVTFYKVGDVSGDVVTIVPTTNGEVVPAHTPIIAQGENGSLHQLSIVYNAAAPHSTPATSLLKGVLAPQQIPSESFIIWTNSSDETGFYRVSDASDKLPANRAYLLLSDVGGAFYQIHLSGGTSSVVGTVGDADKRVQYFDLSGRPVTVLVPGVVYLTSDGKKVIFKRK